MGFKAKSSGIKEQALAQAGTATGAWEKVSVGDGFSFWAYWTASGSPSLTFYVDYSPFEKDGSACAPSSTDRTNYLTATLASAVTTKDTLVRYSCPTAMTEPFVYMRLRAVEGNVAAVTTLTFVACKNVASPY